MRVSLADIRTVRALYKTKLLTPAEPSALRCKSSSDLLDRISLYQGDITKLEVDAIVNAANRRLLGGGGVDGAIHAAAGRELLAECRTLNGCETGDAKITKGYKLPAKHVIHTVGPVYSPSEAGEKAKQLASCYRRSLEIAAENSLKLVAFPSISTGIYGYPIEDATRIALGEVRKYFEEDDKNKFDRVIFVVWSDQDKGVYQRLIPQYFPPDTGTEAEGEEQ